MSHHGREYEDDDRDCRDCAAIGNKFGTAVELIKAIANGLRVGDRGRGLTPQTACDTWLESNGFECQASKKRQRERRAEQLDAEIAKLRAERAKL
jgi:hypothetical protein